MTQGLESVQGCGTAIGVCTRVKHTEGQGHGEMGTGSQGGRTETQKHEADVEIC